MSFPELRNYVCLAQKNKISFLVDRSSSPDVPYVMMLMISTCRYMSELSYCHRVVYSKNITWLRQAVKNMKLVEALIT